MKNIKTVGIKELKNNLSAYLRLVQSGYAILVTDRNEVVAEFREPLAVGAPISPNPLLTLWIQEGKIRAPLGKKRQVYSPSHLKNETGIANQLLDEEREE